MRIRLINKVSLYYIVVVVIWLICVASRLKFNGLVYSLDFGLFQPDGMYYSFKTLEFLGWSDKSGLAEVINWYQANAAKFQSVSLTSFNDPTSTPWLVTRFRFIYPLLSMPFVYLFGLSGMLVIPILSLLCFFLFVQKVAIESKTPTLGTILIFLLGTSPTLLRWTIVNYSDALILALFSLFAYIVYISSESWTIGNLTLLSLIVFLASFTRQTLPIWVLIGAYFLYTKKRSAGFMTILTSLTCSVPSLLTFPYDQFLNSKQDGNLLESLLKFFGNALYVNAIEIAQLVVLDRVLLIILLIALYYAFKFRHETYSHLFLLSTFGAVSINSLVGVAGVNFRYLLPVLPFVALTLLESKYAISLESLFSRSKSMVNKS